MSTLAASPSQLAQSPRRPARGRLTPGALLTGTFAGAVLVLAFWWLDTPAINGLGDWLTNAGRITGLLGGYTIVVQLLLMARVPAIEHGVGADRLARWHSFGGRYTVSLLSAHTLLIIWGYSVSAHINVVRQTSEFLLSYPDVLMATAAFFLLLGVAAASARAARARLRYETWYFIHLYTYIAVALAFAHQFATGANFAGNLPARALWSLMYVVVAGLLLWHRIVVPIRTTLRHRVRVEMVRREAPGVVSIVMRGRHLDELNAESGQFFRWRFLTRDGWWQSHPFSLSAPLRPPWLRITVKELGDHSGELQHVRPGTTVFLEGPYGAFTAARARSSRVLLIAGGAGIAPMRALFETMPARAGGLTLIYRASSHEDLAFRPELDAIAKVRGARVHYLVGPRGGATDPFVGNRLERLAPALRKHDVFLCGSPGLTEAATAAVRRCGVPAGHIHIEDFAF